MQNVLITGAAGFIGFHLTKRLVDDGYRVVGLDNMNNYYDVGLKKSRLNILNQLENFCFYQVDLKDKGELEKIFIEEQLSFVINLAAQAGVRYSIENPQAYIDSNIVGFFNILEMCRNYPVEHLIYASSSSVYGGNKSVPFSTEDNVDHPVSLYAATKKSNELMAHSYSNLYNIPTTGLRFFTVYGPFGRPDMAYFSFTKNIFENRSISIFNNGEMERDFTYIDDIIEGISKLILFIPKSNNSWSEKSDGLSSSFAPYKIYNIGNSRPVTLMKFIEVLEDKIGIKAKKEYLEMQDGDVKKTYADVFDLEKSINFKPNTTLDNGLSSFINWYKEYYKK